MLDDKEVDGAKSGTRPYRLGAFLDGIGWVEHEYGRVWQRENEGFLAAPDYGQIDLIISLCEPAEGPFVVRYSLLVPRDGDEEDYQLASPLPLPDLVNFLSRYREFFECDGRHHLTVSSHNVEVRYDQHNVLYVRAGDWAVDVFTRAGLREERVIFPSPHSHHYHDEHDQVLEDMLERYEWSRIG